MLIAVTGLPGVGKTTVSEELARELKSEVLSTDKIRKGVLEKPGYTTKKKKRVYEEMFRMAKDYLKKEKNVILDATFFKKEWRDKASHLGKELDERVFFVRVNCPEKVVQKRIEKRCKSDSGYSEANFRVHKIMQKKFEPLEREHFVIDTQIEEEWIKKSLDVANKMRIVEKQEKVIDRLQKKYDMQTLQTHISWVMLDGQHAFKIKKPVRFSFVDYSSLRKRKRFCEKENEINGLLSPELYLGVVPAKKKDASVMFNGKGKSVEYAVKMVQLSQSERMDNLIRAGKARQSHIKKIARLLAGFHAKAKEAKKKYGSTKSIRDNFSPAFEIQSTFEKYFQYGEKLETIKEEVDDFIEKNKDLFARRAEEKRVKRCHGDVRTKNIFIHKNRVFIFDAVEFSEKIASCDVGAEIAFLAMDLHMYDKKNWADDLIKYYIGFSGDQDINRLIDFYMCYRALVESLVETYTMTDPEVGEEKKGKSKRACKKYLELAYAFAEKMGRQGDASQ